MFRRRYRKRFRRRAYRKRGGGFWNIAKKAAQGVVRYYLNPEYKFLDSSPTVAPANGGIMTNLSAIALGDNDTDRNGSSIKVTSHLLRGTLTKAASATATKVRVIIFSDTSSNGALPVVADVLQTSNQDSPLNKVNGSRFTVLFDKSYVLTNDTPMRQFKHFKKMQHHIHYLNGTSATSAMGQGPIYMLTISNEPTNAPTVSVNSRMRFLDN